MTNLSRLLTGLVFVTGIALIGFAAGVYIGGNCCVSSDAGLAGGAIVVGYGVMGGGMALLPAIFAARVLPPQQLVGATLVVAVIGGVVGGVILKIYMDSRAEMEEHMQQAYAGMLKFRVVLQPKADTHGTPFRSIAFDWGQKQFKVVASGQRCTAQLRPEDAASMLAALRAVEGIVYTDPSPCAHAPGHVLQLLDMYIPEASGDITKAKIEITEACLNNYPELGAPMAIATDIFHKSDIIAHCQ